MEILKCNILMVNKIILASHIKDAHLSNNIVVQPNSPYSQAVFQNRYSIFQIIELISSDNHKIKEI